jgi:predicted ATPase/class 3 adenylate cyclase/Tfp pilus assembly protein PilF
LLTDIVDSTALNVAVGDVSMATLWEKHDRLSRALMRQYHGKEIGRSDGFLVAFERAVDAAAFATAYHRLLDFFEVPMRARVGIHFGDVELRQNSPEEVASGSTVFDVDGVALPVAARVSSLAGARQTLVTDAVVAHLDPASVKLVSHGHWQVKGIPDPIELFELGDDLSHFLPPDSANKGYRVVLDGASWRPAREIRNSIPAEHDEFVGRGAELRRLADLQNSGARLISVVGIGGVGKTRLVTHFARRWLGEFPGGAWFCDLAEARDIDGIFSAVAQGLDVSLGRSEPRRQLSDVIIGRGECLVIFDNFEQVSALAVETVAFWLDRASAAKFIVTTRERLGIAGEHVVAVDSLVPTDAASMFLHRARANHADFRIGPGDERAIHDLVRLLDGLPLAIELAVGRLAVMSPTAMLTRLHQRFTLLAARGGRPKRQSTLRAAFDWSWELLTPGERSVLAQASVFSGGFTLDAAESVLQLPPDHMDMCVLDALQSLADKSFIRANDGRFNLLVSVREYAYEKLTSTPMLAAESDANMAVERRHGAFFSRPIPGDVKELAADLENVLAACRRAVARGDAQVATLSCESLWFILEVRGPYRLGMELIEACLAMNGLLDKDRIRLTSTLSRCLLVLGESKKARPLLESANIEAKAKGLVIEELRALAVLAELNVIEGNVETAGTQYNEALSRAAELGGGRLQCSLYVGSGIYFNRLGDFEAARSHFNSALNAARDSTLRRWEGAALSNLGTVEANLGNRAAAKSYYDQAIAVARELGERVWEADLLCNLGLFKLEEGDAQAARADLGQSLILARENGLSLLESVVLCNVGLLCETTGEFAEAEASHRQAVELARRRGDRRSEGQFLSYLGLLLAKRGDAPEGRRSLNDAASILRQVKDRMSLAIALSAYAQACRTWGDLEGGRTSFEEATSIAKEIDVAPGSELAISLAKARAALDTVI